MAGETPPGLLVPPAVTALKEEAAVVNKPRGHMERTVSTDIREEREDLEKAAEPSLNAIMDLNLDGTIRWISPSWEELTGALPDTIVGQPIAEIITCDNQKIFTDAIDSMRKDDSKSRIIRFMVDCVGQDDDTEEEQDQEKSMDKSEQLKATTSNEQILLEAQGIMVYDRSTGQESHVSSAHVKIDLSLIRVDHVDDQTCSSA